MYFPLMKSFFAFFLCFICLAEVCELSHIHFNSKQQAMKTITVDKNGHGKFKTIQAAINSISSTNSQWICIRITAGNYREHVRVDKPYVILKGSGKDKTKIVYNYNHQENMGATLAVDVDNFVAMDISFVNSRNLPQYGGSLKKRAQAAAAYVKGDKISFYNCGFYGVQDTLWDVQGRHYYHQTTISGAVDFICGNGQTIFEKSLIHVLGGVLPSSSVGFITAHSRASPSEKTAFIFKECTIDGKAKAYLGRPWGEYARVVYYNSVMSDIVMPEGWDVWNSAGKEDRVTFAQDSCKGDGARRDERVSWEKKLSKKDIQAITSLQFINADKWIEKQPLKYI